MSKVDINVDIGEGFPYDGALLEFATSANVCWGEHAGSWLHTLETLEMCRCKGVRIGAHIGYPDPEHMGRRSWREADAREHLMWMFGLNVQAIRLDMQENVSYIKPHGALYADTAVPTPDDFDAIIPERTASEFYGDVEVAWLNTIKYMSEIYFFHERGVAVMGLMNTAQELKARKEGVHFISEGFADRRYQQDGTLVPRSEPNAVLEDPEEIRSQVLRLAAVVDSICIHGDTPNCVEIAELVRKTLVDGGYGVGY